MGNMDYKINTHQNSVKIQYKYLHNEVILQIEKGEPVYKFNDRFQYFFDKKYQTPYSEKLKLITVDNKYSDIGKRME